MSRRGHPAEGKQEHQRNTQDVAPPHFPIPGQEPGPTTGSTAFVVADWVHNGEQTMSNPPPFPV
jgi:hypothetical protein